MDLRLYNTLSREKELFKPIKDGVASIYTCGPTVYDYVSIGNLRSYIFADTLLRTLRANGFELDTVQNITDVGHLTDDADNGEDKLEKSAEEKGKTVEEIAKMYTDAYMKDRERLSLLEPNVWAKATDHIEEQIEMIKVLEEKDFTYKTSNGVYFDTSKLSDYGKLARLDIEGLKEGARVEKSEEKKNPTDFALWKFSPEGSKRYQEWKSPWGTGFPGWHIECSAMSAKYLTNHFDIHTGGIDHIPVHHTNEIAQNEGAGGSIGANFWMHNEFISIDGQKMSKSLKNIYTLEDLEEKGFIPMAYKYFLHGAHYRQQQNFTWEALRAAQSAYRNLVHQLSTLPDGGDIDADWRNKFMEAINDDLNMPQALAVVWNILKNDINDADKLATILSFDEVLGLDLVRAVEEQKNIPEDIKHKVIEREELRDQEDWDASDRLRDEIKEAGYAIEDTDQGPHIFKL